jgi:hypothetical protein
MGPITYSLCQKPVIGVVMWVTSLCAFPPLFADAPISLAISGETISKSFTVSVEKRYAFDLTFEFPSIETRLSDQIVGSRYDENCFGNKTLSDLRESKRVGLRRTFPIKVTVRREKDRGLVTERVFNSLCVTAHIDSKKWRTVGWVELAQGDYIAEITNLESQAGLDGVKTYVSLVAGHGK